MEKEKLKGQPVNTRRYWVFFGLLTLLLIFPIRFHGFWISEELGDWRSDTLNSNIYTVIGIVIVIILLHFILIRRHYLKQHLPIITVMIICLGLSVHNVGNVEKTRYCREPYVDYDQSKLYTPDWFLTEPAWCTQYSLSASYAPFEVVRIKNTNITIDIWWLREMMFPDGRPHFTG